MHDVFDELSKFFPSKSPPRVPVAVVSTATASLLPAQDLGSSVSTAPHSEPPPRPNQPSTAPGLSRSAPSTPTPGQASRQQDTGGQWIDCIAIPGLPSLRYRRIQSTPHAAGGFSDVWMCRTTYSDDTTQLVAEKVLRRVTRLDENDLRLLRKLAQEIRIWRHLHHPCIAPLMGFTFYPSIALISPWYRNGNVQQYIELHPNCNRLKLLYEVASGLTYLHEFDPPVIHGDIKPDNVLIDDDGAAVIIDFGLSRSVIMNVSETTSSNRGAGNYRWMPPELVLDATLPKSLEGDVYSFASLALKVLTGTPPFRHVPGSVSALVIAAFFRITPADPAPRPPMTCDP
ncbi:hypothetical protein FRB90_010417, partial [Tulasnella sp. 427]